MTLLETRANYWVFNSVVLTPLCWYLTDLSMNCRAYHQNESVQTKKKTHALAGSFKKKKNCNISSDFWKLIFFSLFTAILNFPQSVTIFSNRFSFFFIIDFLKQKHFAVSLQCLKKNLRVHLWSIFYWVEFLQKLIANEEKIKARKGFNKKPSFFVLVQEKPTYKKMSATISALFFFPFDFIFYLEEEKSNECATLGDQH